jgi:GNAT superfamily N-acetyltransferase
METKDIASLKNPKKSILDKGGEIFVALYKNEPVGVGALMKMNDDYYNYEMVKMAVDEKFQGKGIGFALGQAILNHAKELNAKHIFIETNTLLTSAIALYKKLGFKEVTGYSSAYERSNYQMHYEIKE